VEKAFDRRDYPNFLFIRLVCAASVVFSHSFLIGEGSEQNEPLVRLLGPGNILGIYGVFIFFFASGFLITQSAFGSQSAFSYAWKRIIRIYPALLVCALLSALVLGPIFTSAPLTEYFSSLAPVKYLVKTAFGVEGGGWQIATVRFYDSANKMGDGMNGSLWTIPQELICYIITGLLLIAGLLRWWVVALLCAISLPFMTVPHYDWPMTVQNFLLCFPSFAFGALLFFVRRAWGLHGGIALASSGLAIIAALSGRFMEFFPLLGVYPLIWLATSDRVRLPSLKGWGDISYGLYLYAWPVQQTVRVVLGEKATWWGVFGISLPVAALLGYVSWHLLEKHALKLKRPPFNRPFGRRLTVG
jgi:peptidoglycan/LPS O-acetylase OafA/YrhL